MQQSVKIFVCLTVLVGLCACSFTQPTQSHSMQLKLLSPADGPDNRLIKQKITMQSKGLDQQFIAVLRLQHDRLKLAVLMPTGQQLFFLEYDGVKLIQRNTSSIDLPGRDILAIMQFSLWPSDSIRQFYTRKDDWFLDLSLQQRLLLTSAGLLLKVTYQEETIIIVNHLHGYRLTVQPLEK